MLVEKLGASADTCAAPELAASLEDLAGQIDRAAKTGEPDFDAINEFRKVGNDWLAGMGLKPSLLS